MTGEAILSALVLPGSSRVDQRVPKKLLLENGAPTAADKRIINDGLDELHWVAALKPTTIGVPEYRDDVREYLEIAVLRLTLRSAAKATRLVELVHRAVPYPVLLLTVQGERWGLSVAHKRWSQGEAGKSVLEGEVIAVQSDALNDGVCVAAFCSALSLARQPRSTLFALYQGWIDTLVALQAAGITGTFSAARDPVQAQAWREALRVCATLDGDIKALQSAARRETQMARRVEINLELKRLESELARAKGQFK